MDTTPIKLNNNKSFSYYRTLTIIFGVIYVVLQMLFDYGTFSLAVMISITLFLYIFRLCFLYAFIKAIMWKCIEDYHNQEVEELKSKFANLEKKYESTMRRLEYLEDKVNKIDEKNYAEHI